MPAVHFKRKYKPDSNELGNREVVRFCVDHQGIIYALKFEKFIKCQCFSFYKHSHRIILFFD